LGLRQAEGKSCRVAANGRIDQQRHSYVLWSPNPLERFALSDAECPTELADRYISWIGPATLAECQAFSGMSLKACRAAVAALDLIAVAAESPQRMHRSDLEQLNMFKIPKDPHDALVSRLDKISLLRLDVRGLGVRPGCG